MEITKFMFKGFGEESFKRLTRPIRKSSPSVDRSKGPPDGRLARHKPSHVRGLAVVLDKWGGVVSEPEQGRTLFGEVMVPGSGVAGAHGAQADFARPGLTTKHRDAAASAWGYGDSLPGHSIGKDYFGARWYDPSTARWLSEEPLGLDGPNMYTYLGGDAKQNVDLTGLYSLNTSSGAANANATHISSTASSLLNNRCIRQMMYDLGYTRGGVDDFFKHVTNSTPSITYVTGPAASSAIGGGSRLGMTGGLKGNITIYPMANGTNTLGFEFGNAAWVLAPNRSDSILNPRYFIQDPSALANVLGNANSIADGNFYNAMFELALTNPAAFRNCK